MCAPFSQMSWMKRFVPVEVYPLVGAVGIGLGLSAYSGYHMFSRNPEVNPKTGHARYAWDRFDKQDLMTPHFDWLEGRKANERKRAAAMRHEARERD
jgi:hypothetical protein